MAYEPPTGWVETRSSDKDLHVFHTSAECPRIRQADQLRPVSRPYSARRCRGCARVG